MSLLGAAEIRALAAELDVRPTKQWGQNFVIDANTVRKIVKAADITSDDIVVEIGPGLGSLTLALLETAKQVIVVEIDPKLAARLPQTVQDHAPEHAHKLTVIHADAMKVTELPAAPTALVANLPYNVSVPVLLHFFETFASIKRTLVMVQLEVAQRLAADPGSKVYGVPSVKARWYGDVALVGKVGRTVFWPAPNVDSGLVALTRTTPPETTATQAEVWAVIDAAFAQRRKTLRAALAGWAGSPAAAEETLRAAGVDPSQRGEQLAVADFARIAAARG